MLSIRLFICFSMLCVIGCSKQSQPTQDKPADKDVTAEIQVNGPLRVLVLDDPEFAELLRREWSAASEHDVEIRNESQTAVLERLRSGNSDLATDVVIFSSPLLGELAESGCLRALPPELTSSSFSDDTSNEYLLQDVFSTVANKEMKWDRRQIAVSLGSPILLLLVRTDLVTEVPTTWSEINTTTQRLRGELPDDVRPLAEPMQDGWAARLLLSRSAADLYQPSRVSTFFDYSNMRPRITSAPCVRALSEMVATFNRDNEALTPRSTFDLFMSGGAAMAITWPHQDITQQDPIGFPVLISELPGTSMKYDERTKQWTPLDNSRTKQVSTLGHAGRMAAISRSAKNTSLAGIFLGWAGGPDQAKRLCPRSRSSAPFRRSHVAKAVNWCDDRLSASAVAQYGDNVASALTRTEALLSLRIPGQDRYMQALNTSVMRALTGEVTSIAALEEAELAWEEITEELGRKQQISAYRHSLGIDVE